MQHLHCQLNFYIAQFLGLQVPVLSRLISRSLARLVYGFTLLDQQDPVRRCGCPALQARLENHCVPCADLHLDCGSEGSTVLSARALPGYARLDNQNRSFRCLPPEQRCNASAVHSSKVLNDSACADGYMGLMCMDCMSNFYASGKACKKCQDHDVEFPNPWLFVGIILPVVAFMGLWLWRWSLAEPRVEQVRCKSRFSELKEQVQAQGPILLQHCGWAM